MRSDRARTWPEVDWIELLAGSRTSDRPDSLRLEDAQVGFEVGDGVRFVDATGRSLTGMIGKLNPKRARVRCGDEIWVVPYTRLQFLSESIAEERRRRVLRLQDVASQARDLLDSHGLKTWALRFGSARSKLGECRHRQKLIVLSRHHAATGTADQTTDTILHEIAHALAGAEAGHGPAWKALAARLGATPKSCAPESETVRQQRESAKSSFRVGDTVRFVARGGSRKGVIERMNPKRAKVRSGGFLWAVPYARLREVDAADRS